MTDQELDRLLRRALLDAADQEAQTPPETETPLSEGHRRRMREMLRDPLLWFRLRNPYPWRTVARRAAVVLLMLSLSAAMVLAVSPKARADIIRWTMQQDGRRVEFRYHGDGPAQALPQIPDRRPAGGLYGNGAGGIVCRRRCEIYKRRWRYDPSQLSVHERWRGQRF